MMNDSNDLEKYLRMLRPDMVDKDNLSLQVDGGLQVAPFIRVVDACLNSGYRHLHFVSPSSDDLDNMHAEAKLHQAAFLRRLKQQEASMTLMAERYERSKLDEDQKKSAVVKKVLDRVAKEDIDNRAAKLSDMLSGPLPSLQEVREQRDHNELLIKSLEVIRLLISTENDKLQDDELQALEKVVRDLASDQTSLRKLLRRSEQALQDQLLM